MTTRIEDRCMSTPFTNHHEDYELTMFRRAPFANIFGLRNLRGGFVTVLTLDGH